MTTLYRLVELTSGSIVIDGVDISNLGLADVRKGLAIIPQDPVSRPFPFSISTSLTPPFSSFVRFDIRVCVTSVTKFKFQSQVHCEVT